MHSALERNLYLVKEHVGMFKAANNFDIFDPTTGELVMVCREDKLGFFTRMLRFTDYKRVTKFELDIRTPDGQNVLSVKRGVSFFLSKVMVFDYAGQHIGGFKQKFFSVGGAFKVLNTSEQPICELRGKWTSWDFRFLAGPTELAHVSKQWGGLGRELFTSADNYVLQISQEVPPDNPIRALILAAVLCIDMVLKE